MSVSSGKLLQLIFFKDLGKEAARTDSLVDRIDLHTAHSVWRQRSVGVQQAKYFLYAFEAYK